MEAETGSGSGGRKVGRWAPVKARMGGELRVLRRRYVGRDIGEELPQARALGQAKAWRGAPRKGEPKSGLRTPEGKLG